MWLYGFQAFDRADSITESPSRLLVGFAKGQLLEFDILAGKLLRTLDDVHPPGAAVLHVRFVNDYDTKFHLIVS